MGVESTARETTIAAKWKPRRGTGEVPCKGGSDKPERGGVWKRTLQIGSEKTIEVGNFKGGKAAKVTRPTWQKSLAAGVGRNLRSGAPRGRPRDANCKEGCGPEMGFDLTRLLERYSEETRPFLSDEPEVLKGRNQTE